MRLPPDVGLLVNLRTLDISSNKLRSLPAELGELIHLRLVIVNLLFLYNLFDYLIRSTWKHFIALSFALNYFDHNHNLNSL